MYGYGYRHTNKKRTFGLSPSAGSFVPLSWEGAQTAEYVFSVDKDTQTTYNSIIRDTTPTSFDMAIFSKETLSSDTAFVFSGDIQTNAAQSSWFGFGLKSNTGIGFADLEFALWGFVSGGNIEWRWYESGTYVNGTPVATTTSGDLAAWRIEFDGANGIEVFVNNVSVITRTSSFSSDTLCMKILGRNANTRMGDHIALKTVAQPNKQLLFMGDSITFGRETASATANGSYPPIICAYTNHKQFANPITAVSGNTTALLISGQLPDANTQYNAGYAANIASVMIGINDIRASVALATIQTNISTIVSTLQGYGYTVVIHTVLRDFATAWADRITLNTWINAGSSGADYVIDHTTSILETDSSLFEVDQLHPNADGMIQIALDSWETFNSL